jgi:hypothetical protein
MINPCAFALGVATALPELKKRWGFMADICVLLPNF